jgi:ABC-type uncharacterized transport system ATPase subunit
MQEGKRETMDRYSIISYINGAIMETDSTGDYVLYSDHKAAMEEKDKYCGDVCDQWLLTVQGKEKQIASLTAERDRLKTALEEIETMATIENVPIIRIAQAALKGGR